MEQRKIGEITVQIVRDSQRLKVGAVDVDQTHIAANPGAFSADSFFTAFETALTTIKQHFPEVPVDEPVVDYGVASVELIRRVESCRIDGLPISVVDIFEYVTPCEICAHSVIRLLQEES